jgi:hypothetical protein
MIKTFITSMCLVLSAACLVEAGTINILVDNYSWLTDSGPQIISVYAYADTATNVDGMDFIVGIQGTTPGDPPPAGSPVFTAADVISSPGLFSGNHQTPQLLDPAFTLPGTWAGVGGTTSSGSVALSTNSLSPTLLGTVTIDTTGVTPGTYQLDVQYITLALSGVEQTMNFDGANGTLDFEATPEPASMLLMAGLMACGVPAMLVYRRRGSRASATAC